MREFGAYPCDESARSKVPTRIAAGREASERADRRPIITLARRWKPRSRRWKPRREGRNIFAGGAAVRLSIAIPQHDMNLHRQARVQGRGRILTDSNGMTRAEQGPRPTMGIRRYMRRRRSAGRDSGKWQWLPLFFGNTRESLFLSWNARTASAHAAPAWRRRRHCRRRPDSRRRTRRQQLPTQSMSFGGEF